MGYHLKSRPIGVSVIICCYNSSKSIFRTLECLSLQEELIFPFQVIVVNNNSNDNTVDIVKEFINKSNLNIKLVHEFMPGLMHAREAGLKNSKYEYIQFCDDDNFLSPNYIVSIFKIFNNNELMGACGGLGIPLLDVVKTPIWFDYYKKSFAVGSQKKNPQDHLYGAGVAIRYSALEAIYNKGFKSFLTGRKGGVLLAGDDGELILALMICGYELHASDDFYFHHFIKQSRLKKEYLYKLHFGFGMMYPVIDIYRDFLRTKKIYSSFKYKIKFTFKIIKSFLVIFLKRGINRKVQINLFKGALRGFLYYFNDYNKIILVINKLKK